MKPLIKICGIKDLNILNQLIELEANPPKALYKEAGRLFVLKTIEVITFFFKSIFLICLEKTKNLVILFFES